MNSSSYNIVSLIRRKRDGGNLTKDEIQFLIDSYTRDELPDYQMSAFLMAVFLRGMNDEEASAIAYAMLHSGKVMDLSEVPGIKVDKHSTGGVGDKLSLILAPIVAAAGVPVPMISGRGLGHTGGTLDKLESIPGFDVNLDLVRYVEVIKKHNVVFIGQTEDIAPADKRLYALRDVTATVECIPLIASSIMSKKLAEGIDALVLDVKYGSGAFIKDIEEAGVLARRLVDIGTEFKKNTVAYLTNMDQPLGYKIGNWFEVEESIECLRGEWPDDVREITLLLSGAMIWLGGKAATLNEGIELAIRHVEDGSALRKLREIVEEQGGDTGMIDNPENYPKAAHQAAFTADADGFVTGIDAYSVGMASLELGAGRREKKQPIDPTAGIILHKKLGDEVKKGETIAVLHTNKADMLSVARNLMQNAYKLGSAAPKPGVLISRTVDAKGIHPFDYNEVPALKT
ncbi:MAG: thymidine phosphorylase [Candidatus Cyclonatronum sp.]|uniref:thymidine phosphorylase n=1 Tax=Cyclonatronum sp. TaxID=3024185 RepID=UPI0025B98906|nr:thymidine phosphorylase [Cyclonatronum sp.]MCC5933035.1 thymidine phosphorylase [Balneolales bacterium]MCH8485708.1 thymidine phosphorylase [Cyclonatronum sp.]